MAWLVAGLWMAYSIHRSRVALQLPWPIQRTSTERRLSRFLHNKAVRALAWYEPGARQLSQQAVATMGEVRLILDPMPVHHRTQVAIVNLAFRRRALPRVWTWLRKGKGHRSRAKQMALVARVHRWIPQGTPVLVVGDNASGSVALIRQLEPWRWDYAR